MLTERPSNSTIACDLSLRIVRQPNLEPLMRPGIFEPWDAQLWVGRQLGKDVRFYLWCFEPFNWHFWTPNWSTWHRLTKNIIWSWHVLTSLTCLDLCNWKTTFGNRLDCHIAGRNRGSSQGHDELQNQLAILGERWHWFIGSLQMGRQPTEKLHVV